MPPAPAKLVTVITDFATRDTVERQLAALGIRAFTVSQVRGHGRHGVIRGGLLQSENVQFTVVTDEPHAAKLMEWAERELVANFPGIVWMTDAQVVRGSRPKPKRG